MKTTTRTRRSQAALTFRPPELVRFTFSFLFFSFVVVVGVIEYGKERTRVVSAFTASVLFVITSIYNNNLRVTWRQWMRFHPDRPIRRWCWPWPPVSARPAFADSGSVSSSSRSAWRCSPQRRTLHIKGEEKTTGRCDRYVALVQRIESVVVVVEGNTQKAMMDIHLIAEESATLFTSPRMQSTYLPFRPPPYPYQADCEYWTNHGRLVRRPITNRRYRIEISRSEERNVDDSEELGYRSHKSGQILPFPSRSPFFFSCPTVNSSRSFLLASM